MIKREDNDDGEEEKVLEPVANDKFRHKKVIQKRKSIKEMKGVKIRQKAKKDNTIELSSHFKARLLSKNTN